MAFQRCAGTDPTVRVTRAHLRTVGAAVAILAFSAASAPAQPAAPVRSTFQDRIEVAAMAMQDNPRFKGLNQQQRVDRIAFVVGNTLVLLLHEMGHVLVHQMNLPVLGREEDAADTYAALTMLRIGTAFSLHGLANAAQGWFLNDRRDQQMGRSRSSMTSMT